MSHSDLQKGHAKARDAHHALADFLSIFASVENKGSVGYIPENSVGRFFDKTAGCGLSTVFMEFCWVA